MLGGWLSHPSFGEAAWFGTMAKDIDFAHRRGSWSDLATCKLVRLASTPLGLPKGVTLSQLVKDGIRVANVLASTTYGFFDTRPATTAPIAFASCGGFVGRCASAEGKNPDLHNNTLHSCTVQCFYWVISVYYSVQSSEDELFWPLWNLLGAGEVFWCVFVQPLSLQVVLANHAYAYGKQLAW